jgi:MoaA/NifB/PqqE/SkfB family radical SAM enzyme
MTDKFLPKWIAWEVTQRCNLKCVHCRASSDDTSAEGDFTTEEALTLLDDITELSTPVVVLSGGEPLLRKDVFTIAAKGTELGLRMCMATNGVLIDDAVCEEMKKSQIRMVSLSLDGSTAKTHDDFRQQPGAFEGTLRGIEFLKKHGIPFLINSSFTKRNQGDIGNIFRLAKSLGATAWYMFMIVPTGRGEDILTELITAEDYEDILDIQEEDLVQRLDEAGRFVSEIQSLLD